jgi:hypothetical protein
LLNASLSDCTTPITRRFFSYGSTREKHLVTDYSACRTILFSGGFIAADCMGSVHNIRLMHVYMRTSTYTSLMPDIGRAATSWSCSFPSSGSHTPLAWQPCSMRKFFFFLSAYFTYNTVYSHMTGRYNVHSLSHSPFQRLFIYSEI